MSKNESFPLRTTAIQVIQPLGDFYAVSLPAAVLLAVSYSNPFRVDETDESAGWYSTDGSQREFDAKRAKEIARFVESADAAFPNAIILGANYTPNGDFVGDDESLSWRIVRDAQSGTLSLYIPSAKQVAAIIDGQHRLGGIAEACQSAHNMELLCAVYLDLPAPFQAYLFATVNFNQKKVDKSLAYELFGFKLDSKAPDSWPPEKLAVFLCRRLNAEVDSPFRHRIKVVAQNREAFSDEAGSLVSTATIVEGLLALFSQRPRLDRDDMGRISVEDGRSRKQLEPDSSPLRELYLAGQDAVIYELVRNYFKAVKGLLWNNAAVSSYITRTVGIQALFDVLKELSTEFVASKNLSEKFIGQRIEALQHIDYEDNFFQASGKGRVRLRNSMRIVLKLVSISVLPENDRTEYRRITEIE